MLHLLLLFFVVFVVNSQEIKPSGPNAATVTLGDYVRDLLLEQVSACSLCNCNKLSTLQWLYLCTASCCHSTYHCQVCPAGAAVVQRPTLLPLAMRRCRRYTQVMRQGRAELACSRSAVARVQL
jgi:hypothetical protein